MSLKKEILKVNDSKDFHYEVTVEHQPHFGFSTAYFRDRIIAQCELGRILPPTSDDDREWEMYEERFADWRSEILSNLKVSCTLHFNKKV